MLLPQGRKHFIMPHSYSVPQHINRHPKLSCLFNIDR